MTTNLVVSNNDGDPTIQFDGNAASARLGYSDRAGTLTVTDPAGQDAIYLNGRNSSVTIGGPNGRGSLVINDAQNTPVVNFDAANGDFIFGNANHFGSFIFTDGTSYTCTIDKSTLTLGATGSSGFLILNNSSGGNAVTIEGNERALRLFNASGENSVSIDGSQGTLNFFSPLTPGTPALKLSANGIQAGASIWPDFVFEEQYELTSIDALRDYVRQNKKLPELPSAEEVKANGFDLIENQRVLLKKIEEMTLYIVQLHERLEKLERGTSQSK